jgi:hypothetical protein
MGEVIRCWDIGQTRPTRIDRPGRAREVLVAGVADPWTKGVGSLSHGAVDITLTLDDELTLTASLIASNLPASLNDLTARFSEWTGNALGKKVVSVTYEVTDPFRGVDLVLSKLSLRLACTAIPGGGAVNDFATLDLMTTGPQTAAVVGGAVSPYWPSPVFGGVDIVAASLVVTKPASGVWAFDVFGLDGRMRYMPVVFFRRSAWWAARVADGSYDPGRTLAGVDGEGWASASCALKVLRRDELGVVHVVGDLPAAQVWLRGGAVPDGAELVTGADGIRLEVSGELAAVADPSVACSWDIVAALEVMPNERLGCSGLAEEIIESLEMSKAPPLALASPYVVGGA